MALWNLRCRPAIRLVSSPEALTAIIVKMRVATWCVDGINSRLDYLCHWLSRRRPDIVALQKTYVATGKAPVEALRKIGYESIFYSRDGEYRNGWGVAVLCQESLETPRILQEGLPGQSGGGARLLTVRSGDLEFSSVYAPYGNPAKRKFKGALEHKIMWLKTLVDHLGVQREGSVQRVLAGDFNVVTDGEPIPGVLNHTQEERVAFRRVLDLGFEDLYRLAHATKNGFDFGFDLHKPMNSRLFLILGTYSVASRLNKACVDREYRQPIKDLPDSKWAQGTPIIVDLR